MTAGYYSKSVIGVRFSQGVLIVGCLHNAGMTYGTRCDNTDYYVLSFFIFKIKTYTCVHLYCDHPD